jgi:signal transduction histidine kinase
MTNRTLLDGNWSFINSQSEKITEEKYPVRLVLKEKKPIRNVVGGIIRPHKNDTVWVLVNADPLFNKDGSIKEVIVIFSDITKIKNAEAEIIKLNQRVMLLQEDERQRVAKDLHDSVGQTIFAAKINIEAYMQSPDLYEKQLDKGLEFLDMASQELREIYMNLYPSILNDLGLEMAVKWFADNISESAGIKAEIKTTLKKRLPHDIEVNLFRIIQELLSNILKHAGADRFSLSLGEKKGIVKLTVKDNGCGFEGKESRPDAPGCGISNIKNRVNYLNGIFLIEKNKPQGTKINITIVLPEVL